MNFYLHTVLRGVLIDASGSKHEPPIGKRHTSSTHTLQVELAGKATALVVLHRAPLGGNRHLPEIGSQTRHSKFAGIIQLELDAPEGTKH